MNKVNAVGCGVIAAILSLEGGSDLGIGLAKVLVGREWRLRWRSPENRGSVLQDGVARVGLSILLGYMAGVAWRSAPAAEQSYTIYQK